MKKILGKIVLIVIILGATALFLMNVELIASLFGKMIEGFLNVILKLIE